MDPTRFDALVRTLARGGTRRRLLARLVALPPVGRAPPADGGGRRRAPARSVAAAHPAAQPQAAQHQEANKKQDNNQNNNNNNKRTRTVATVRVVAVAAVAGRPSRCLHPQWQCLPPEQRVLCGQLLQLRLCRDGQPVHRGRHPHRLCAPRHRLLRQRRRLLRRAGQPVQRGGVVLCPQLCRPAVRRRWLWRGWHVRLLSRGADLHRERAVSRHGHLRCADLRQWLLRGGPLPAGAGRQLLWP